MKTVFKRPAPLSDVNTHYCPGCGHGVVHRLIAQAIEEFSPDGHAIVVPPIGCSGIMFDYFEFDMVCGPHGRGPALATAIKRAHPDTIVFTYQGDGDIASIGLSEIMHCASRGEKFTAIMVNNANYGMTGGQMAPTTLPGQVTTTSPAGRDTELTGYPMRMAEMLAQFDAVAYSARVSVHNAANVLKAKKAVRRAFETQVKKQGFGFVEVLCPCPTNWKLTPVKAAEWLEENMIPYFPLGEFRNTEGGTGK